MPGVILLALAALATPAPATPRGFVEQVYAGYRQADYSPLERIDPTFAPALAAAIRKDQRLAKGEVGFLDGDPLCQCQDAAGLRARIVRMTPTGAGQAIVRVSIALEGEKSRSAQLSLVRTPAGWRIADVVGSDGHSLLSDLRRSNRRR